MPNCTNCDQVNDLWNENQKLKKAHAEVCAERDAYKEELEIINEAKMRSDDLYRLLRRYRSEVKWERKKKNEICNNFR